jgi:pyruvate dehydrogenase E2 component (dihydrolipoamide acetyltransferase)
MEFKLPEIGEGVHEGEIVKWLVKPGDSVQEDQALVEIMTDKATVEVPTSTAGVVETLNAKEGDVVKVGQVIATLKSGGAAKAAPAATAASAPVPTAAAASTAPQPAAYKAPAMAAAPAAPIYSAPVPNTASFSGAAAGGAMDYIAEAGNVLASPATRRMARELGVDLRTVQATGPKGRVLKDDLQRYLAASPAGAPSFVSPGAAPQMVPQQAKAPASRPVNPFTSNTARETLLPLRGVRKKIAEGMRHSKDTAAHFTYVDECDVSELVKFRAEMKKVAEEKGIKLTYLPFLVKGVVQALKKFPMLNSSLVEEGPQAGNIVVKNYYNIGIAVDTAEGLMVPVVKDADRKSILEIAWEIQDLATRAAAKKLTMDDLKGGTFTITNAGTIGGLFATPIINHPEVAILGFNKIAKRPHIKSGPKGDEIIVADMTWFSISVDHRVVDGADAARFINEFMGLVSNPKKLMLEMI